MVMRTIGQCISKSFYDGRVTGFGVWRDRRNFDTRLIKNILGCAQ